MFSIIFTCIELVVSPIIYRFNIGHIINLVNNDSIKENKDDEKTSVNMFSCNDDLSNK